MARALLTSVLVSWGLLLCLSFPAAGQAVDEAQRGAEAAAAATVEPPAKEHVVTQPASLPASTEAAPSDRVQPRIRRRLPPFFGQLALMDSQKQAVYALQEKYQQELDELMERLAALRQERDEQLLTVLNPEQQSMLLAKQEERRARARTARLRTSSDGEGEVAGSSIRD
jgi:Spy/CpxP family protein refolding chaperone